MWRGQEDAFIELTHFTSSGRETGEKLSKVTGRVAVGTDNEYADGEIFLSLRIFSSKKEKFSQSSFEELRASGGTGVSKTNGAK